MKKKKKKKKALKMTPDSKSEKKSCKSTNKKILALDETLPVSACITDIDDLEK